MIDRLFDRLVYCAMVAVIVLPEPTTFAIGVILLIGTLGYWGRYSVPRPRGAELPNVVFATTDRSGPDTPPRSAPAPVPAVPDATA